MDKAIYSRSEVLDYMGISLSTFYRWVDVGLPTVKINRKVFVMHKDLMSFIERMDGVEFKENCNSRC